MDNEKDETDTLKLIDDRKDDLTIGSCHSYLQGDY